MKIRQIVQLVIIAVLITAIIATVIVTTRTALVIFRSSHPNRTITITAHHLRSATGICVCRSVC